MGHHPEAVFLGSPDDEAAWGWLPLSVKPAFLRQAFLIAQSRLSEGASELSALKATAALGWELGCVRFALADGERFDAHAQALKTQRTGYPLYAKGQDPSTPPGLATERLRIQNDVPIVRRHPERGDLPYIVECKQAWSRPYGQAFGINPKAVHRLDVGTLNQLLRYQAALDWGLVAGVTVEIDGRIHPTMVEWLCRGLDGEGSRVPGIEVMWRCPQPDGSSVRVCIKKGEGTGRRPLVPDPMIQALEARLSDGSPESAVLYQGQVDSRAIAAPDRRALLDRPVVTPAGRTVRVSDQPWHAEDVATWRAYRAESHRQTAARVASLFAVPSAQPRSGSMFKAC